MPVHRVYIRVLKMNSAFRSYYEHFADFWKGLLKWYQNLLEHSLNICWTKCFVNYMFNLLEKVFSTWLLKVFTMLKVLSNKFDFLPKTYHDRTCLFADSHSVFFIVACELSLSWLKFWFNIPLTFQHVSAMLQNKIYALTRSKTAELFTKT